MTIWILAALGLYLLQTLLGPVTRWLFGSGNHFMEALGPRDNPPPQTTLGARFERALQNMQEALFIFLPVALLLEMKGLAAGVATTGAMTFVIARALYVPAYASGLFGLRSVVWGAGHTGLVIMVCALICQ
jgi:uncharacterized MAPEG superfamily protein